MYPVRLAFKNVISRKSSIVIIIFIAVAISFLVVINSIFDSTDTGLEKTFIQSFTGDVVIRPKSKSPLSLFGDETPVTGSLTEIPHLIPFEQIRQTAQETEGVESLVPQLTYAAALNINDFRYTTALFGVGEGYFDIMAGITVTEGIPFADGERGIMLNTKTVESILSNTGYRVNIGDSMQIVTSTGSSFSIRAVPVTAIYEYPAENSTLERISLIDAVTLRDLMNIADSSIDEEDIDISEKDLMIQDFSIDDLFGDTEDYVSQESDGVDLDEFKYDNQAAMDNQKKYSSVWNFIICRTSSSEDSSKVIKSLNRYFKHNDIEAEAVNWRTAAGSTALMIYYIKVIFNIGIILILATGFIVVNNTLVISALDRIKETGTLKAIGANRFFISMQFFAESFILTVSAGILGCILGIIFTTMINSAGFTLTNLYLIQLFGGTRLTTAVTLSSIAKCMLLSLVLSVIGSIYPVYIALNTSPVAAMRGVS